MSTTNDESYTFGGGPTDPEDWAEAEDREEAIRCLGRMEDVPQEDDEELFF